MITLLLVEETTRVCRTRLADGYTPPVGCSFEPHRPLIGLALAPWRRRPGCRGGRRARTLAPLLMLIAGIGPAAILGSALTSLHRACLWDYGSGCLRATGPGAHPFWRAAWATAVSVKAIPRPKNRTSQRPRTGLPIPQAMISTARAPGQGSKPPVTPAAMTSRRRTAPD